MSIHKHDICFDDFSFVFFCVCVFLFRVSYETTFKLEFQIVEVHKSSNVTFRKFVLVFSSSKQTNFKRLRNTGRFVPTVCCLPIRHFHCKSTSENRAVCCMIISYLLQIDCVTFGFFFLLTS